MFLRLSHREASPSLLATRATPGHEPRGAKRSPLGQQSRQAQARWCLPQPPARRPARRDRRGAHCPEPSLKQHHSPGKASGRARLRLPGAHHVTMRRQTAGLLLCDGSSRAWPRRPVTILPRVSSWGASGPGSAPLLLHPSPTPALHAQRTRLCHTPLGRTPSGPAS